MLRTSVLAILLMALYINPAEAHRLKLFAVSEDGAISGYAFFTGGGRPKGSTITIKDASGKQRHATTTDKDGAFRWNPNSSGRFTVTINTGEGHIASTTVTIGTPTDPAGTAVERPASSTARTTKLDRPASGTPANLEQMIERAVERQVQPLRRDISEYEARLRFKDIIAGLAMIIGLAGIAMWAAARNRRND